mmetsp:Transcript_14199/g.22173  ORF Transcript_14199/g.22173 Transcript_14199/m.22173 type:complete len:1038 (-) Transcript_14199:49-3162(-)|eukprot:CAMPEP_0197035904 /NCGR_PEP_ID=MMETSP1384-20130603/13556_1 /TAXON_ID=29189 /ORGANISM="Ammonia sp." /LENGTH=1037 /DNA_ID=CAMNT_0042466011 /DNA_START=22 /DNA_END=3135 /DNA_ORIENTATION=+
MGSVGSVIKKIPIIGGIYEIGEGIADGIKTGDWGKAAMEIGGGLLDTAFQCTPEGFAAKVVQDAVEIPMEIERDRWKDKVTHSQSKAEEEMHHLKDSIANGKILQGYVESIGVSLKLLKVEAAKPNAKFMCAAKLEAQSKKEEIKLEKLSYFTFSADANVVKGVQISEMTLSSLMLTSKLSDTTKFTEWFVQKVGTLVEDVEKVAKYVEGFGKFMKGVAVMAGAVMSAALLGSEIKKYTDKYYEIEKERRNLLKTQQEVDGKISKAEHQFDPLAKQLNAAFPGNNFSSTDLPKLEEKLKEITKYLQHLEADINQIEIIIRTQKQSVEQYRKLGIDMKDITENGWIPFDVVKQIIDSQKKDGAVWFSDVTELDAFVAAMCNLHFSLIYNTDDAAAKEEHYKILLDAFRSHKIDYSMRNLVTLYEKWLFIHGHIEDSTNLTARREALQTQHKEKYQQLSEMAKRAELAEKELNEVHQSIINLSKALQQTDVKLITNPHMERNVAVHGQHVEELGDHSKALQSGLEGLAKINFDDEVHQIEQDLFDFYFNAEDVTQKLQHLFEEIKFTKQAVAKFLQGFDFKGKDVEDLEHMTKCMHLVEKFFFDLQYNIDALYASLGGKSANFPQEPSELDINHADKYRYQSAFCGGDGGGDFNISLPHNSYLCAITLTKWEANNGEHLGIKSVSYFENGGNDGDDGKEQGTRTLDAVHGRVPNSSATDEHTIECKTGDFFNQVDVYNGAAWNCVRGVTFRTYLGDSFSYGSTDGTYTKTTVTPPSKYYGITGIDGRNGFALDRVRFTFNIKLQFSSLHALKWYDQNELFFFAMCKCLFLEIAREPATVQHERIKEFAALLTKLGYTGIDEKLLVYACRAFMHAYDIQPSLSSYWSPNIGLRLYANDDEKEVDESRITAFKVSDGKSAIRGIRVFEETASADTRKIAGLQPNISGTWSSVIGSGGDSLQSSEFMCNADEYIEAINVDWSCSQVNGLQFITNTRCSQSFGALQERSMHKVSGPTDMTKLIGISGRLKDSHFVGLQFQFAK